MIVIRIEVWPFGNKDKKREIGNIIIGNDCTGTPELGNYICALTNPDDKSKCLKAGRVKNYLRSLPVYHLVAKAIEACLKGKSTKYGKRLVDKLNA